MKSMTKKAITIGGVTLLLGGYMATPTETIALDGVDIVVHPR